MKHVNGLSQTSFGASVNALSIRQQGQLMLMGNRLRKINTKDNTPEVAAKRLLLL